MAESQVEILRDTENFLNRYCRLVSTKEIIYYVEIGTGVSITIHRGPNKDNPVIATASCCEDKVGTSKIDFSDLATTIVLTHSVRRFSLSPPKTTFTVDEKEYYWKGYNDLFEKKSDKLVAQYSPVEGVEDKVGTIVFGKADKFLTDVIVVSALILQQRSNARKRAGSMVD